MLATAVRRITGSVGSFSRAALRTVRPGLASQSGNQVTLSYRSERFSCIKERDAKRIDEFARSGKLKVLFNSNPVEFKPESVRIDVKGSAQEIPNDFVWIFAGGTPPNDFLKKLALVLEGAT